jgi:hypothetical protein
MILLLGLLAIAVALTGVMFVSKNAMLGLPSAIFWAIAGGQAYIVSTAIWDIYYLVFFACALGMTTFTALAAYGLREKRDSLGDEAMGQSEGKYIDESGKEKTDLDESNKPARHSDRTQRLHDRAERRRSKSAGNGEFS